MIESHALKCWTTALGDGGKSSKTARADGEPAMGGGGRAAAYEGTEPEDLIARMKLPGG